MAAGQAFITLGAIGVLTRPPNFVDPTARIRVSVPTATIRPAPTATIRPRIDRGVIEPDTVESYIRSGLATATIDA